MDEQKELTGEGISALKREALRKALMPFLGTHVIMGVPGGDSMAGMLDRLDEIDTGELLAKLDYGYAMNAEDPGFYIRTVPPERVVVLTADPMRKHALLVKRVLDTAEARADYPDRAALRAALLIVLEIHRPMDEGWWSPGEWVNGDWRKYDSKVWESRWSCADCEAQEMSVDWPCRTVKAIIDKLGDDS